MEELRCGVYEFQPCAPKRKDVLCCRTCGEYETCGEHKCQNDAEICGFAMVATEKAVQGNSCNRKRVIGINVMTGDEMEFSMMTEAARYCDVTLDVIRHRIKTGKPLNGMVWRYGC